MKKFMIQNKSLAYSLIAIWIVISAIIDCNIIVNNPRASFKEIISGIAYSVIVSIIISFLFGAKANYDFKKANESKLLIIFYVIGALFFIIAGTFIIINGNRNLYKMIIVSAYSVSFTFIYIILNKINKEKNNNSENVKRNK